MPIYKIWLRDKREAKVEGDRLVLGTMVSAGGILEALDENDVGVVRDDRLVAHFRAADVAGYQEMGEDAGFGSA